MLLYNVYSLAFCVLSGKFTLVVLAYYTRVICRTCLIAPSVAAVGPAVGVRIIPSVQRSPGPPENFRTSANNKAEPPVPKRQPDKLQVVPKAFQNGAVSIKYKHLPSSQESPAWNVYLRNRVKQWRLYTNVKLLTSKSYMLALNRTTAELGEDYYLQVIPRDYDPNSYKYWDSIEFKYGAGSKEPFLL